MGLGDEELALRVFLQVITRTVTTEKQQCLEMQGFREKFSRPEDIDCTLPTIKFSTREDQNGEIDNHKNNLNDKDFLT